MPEVILAGNTRYLQVGGQVLAQTEAGNWQYIQPDHLGSVRHLTDGAGQVEAYGEYDPFGVPVATYGVESAFGYTGEQEDESGLLFLRARYYDARTGRFSQKDAWRGDLWRPNTQSPSYLYTSANPINYTDPTGFDFLNPWNNETYGEINHIMIQKKYMMENPGLVIPEARIPNASLSEGSPWQLKRVEPGDYWEGGYWSIIAEITGLRTARYGKIDILDETRRQIFEIKPRPWAEIGLVKAVWYMENYNAIVGPKRGLVELGYNYSSAPDGVIVGIDSRNPGQFIVARLATRGVIEYWSRRLKDQEQVPYYIFEFNPRTNEVERTHRLTTTEAVGLICAPAVAIVGTIVLLGDPVPGNETEIPKLWAPLFGVR